MDIKALYHFFLQFPSVQTDTRKIKNGDIYFALKGPNFNGNTFAQQALELGAAYAIIDDEQYATNEKIILVKDALETLQELAKYHRLQLNIPFIAITGSNGKTTSKELITKVLQQKYITYATEGNLNNHIGVPLTILKIKQDAQIAVIEMGANHQKEIASYCQIAMPNFGIINNCGKAHLEGFGGIDGVRKGKGELYDYLRTVDGTIFINKDYDYLLEMALGIEHQISYGTTENATYCGKITNNDMMLNVAAKHNSTQFSIHSNLVGEYNLPNILLAFAVGSYFKVPNHQIKFAIENYFPDNSRSQFIKKENNSIILDAYNANPTSMRAAITNFAKLDGKKILWLGAMKEMGADSAFEHKSLIEFIKQWKWDQIILVGIEYEDHLDNQLLFENSTDAANYVKHNKPQDALILIKGSRGSKMELLFDCL